MANRYTPKELCVSRKQQNAVMEVLERYIGEPCPTNSEIAEEANIKLQMACNAITALIRRKELRREGGYKGRTLIITATGESTMQGPPRSLKGNSRGNTDCIIKWDGGEDQKGMKDEKKRMLYKDVTDEEVKTKRVLVLEEEKGWRQP